MEAELFRGRRLSEKSNREKLDAFAAELVKERSPTWQSSRWRPSPRRRGCRRPPQNRPPGPLRPPAAVGARPPSRRRRRRTDTDWQKPVRAGDVDGSPSYRVLYIARWNREIRNALIFPPFCPPLDDSLTRGAMIKAALDYYYTVLLSPCIGLNTTMCKAKKERCH